MTSLLCIVASLVAAVVAGRHSRRMRGAGYFAAAVLAAIQTAAVLFGLLTLRNPVE